MQLGGPSGMSENCSAAPQHHSCSHAAAPEGSLAFEAVETHNGMQSGGGVWHERELLSCAPHHSCSQMAAPEGSLAIEAG